MRNRRPLFFLALSIMSGFAAMIAYQNQMRVATRAASEPVIQTTPMVMAVEDLPTGVAIEAIQLQVVEWPSEYLPMGGIHSIADAVNRIPERRINAGEPILDSMLLEVGRQAGLAALIEPDHRAMSVKADAVVGVGGFVQPGSRVDVLAQLRTIDRENGATPYSRTILQNVKVLAIDQSFERMEGGEPTLASVVTLEVDPTEAQLLSYASAEGSLQLAMRNDSDAGLVKLPSTTPKDFMDPRPQQKPRKRVAKAPRSSIESIRGSDVTRQYL